LNSQSLNPYSYILNNPFSGTDPTGYANEPVPDCNTTGQSGSCSYSQTGSHIQGKANISADANGHASFTGPGAVGGRLITNTSSISANGAPSGTGTTGTSAGGRKEQAAPDSKKNSTGTVTIGNDPSPSTAPRHWDEKSASSPRHRYGKGKDLPEVPGYPESGESSWRGSLDSVFYYAAADYNQKHGLEPGDYSYIDAYTIKAWAMIESGGTKQAFLTDPLQVNKAGDAAADKMSFLGLTRGQQMTPTLSVSLGLEWWRHKGDLHENENFILTWKGDRAAFELYNANDKMDKFNDQGVKVKHYVWYADQIIKLSEQMRASAGGN
jgi:hypothetical protein